MQLDRRGAEPLFQVLSERGREELGRDRQQRVIRRAGRAFTDLMFCAAIVDRLTFGGNIIETGTDS